MSEARPFLFGKLPAFGDFLCRGLATDARGAWDRRCVNTLKTTQARYGYDFGRMLETSPPRGFVLAPNVAEAYWQAGCAAFSCDRVGRPFLFVIGVVGGQALHEDGEWIAASLESCLYDAFLHDRDPAALLDDAIDAIGERREPTAAGWMLMRDWQTDWASA